MHWTEPADAADTNHELEKQLGRTLAVDDIAHYHKIVIALTATMRLMAEIDEVIDTHGGWPGAFHTSKEGAGHV